MDTGLCVDNQLDKDYWINIEFGSIGSEKNIDNYVSGLSAGALALSGKVMAKTGSSMGLALEWLKTNIEMTPIVSILMFVRDNWTRDKWKTTRS